MERIILASASQRRRELLSQLGLKFEVMPSDADEKFDLKLSCEENVQKTAYNKACGISSAIDGSCIIIGADTVVSINGDVLGKPIDDKDAERMLSMLGGTTHYVYTGYAVIRKDDYKIITGFEKTAVTFRKLTDSEIKRYISTGEPMDKAGAYGIQGIGASFVSRIEGDYSNVVGLPLCSLAQVLNEFNIDILE